MTPRPEDPCRDPASEMRDDIIAELLTMLKRVRKQGGIENLKQLDEMDELIGRAQNIPHTNQLNQ